MGDFHKSAFVKYITFINLNKSNYEHKLKSKEKVKIRDETNQVKVKENTKISIEGLMAVI